jgi:excisionase family DNA binding protein
MSSQPEILNRKEAAQFLRVSVRSLDYLIASQTIPHCKILKKAVRFTRQQLQDYLKQTERGGNGK